MAQIVHVTTLTDPVAVDQPAAPVTALEIGQTASGPRLYATSPAGGVVSAYALSGAGPAQLVDQQSLGNPPAAGGGTPPPDVEISLHGQRYSVVLDHATDAVELLSLNPTGSTTLVATMGAAQGLGISTPTQLAALEVAGTAYVVVGAAGSSSLTVLEVTAAGELIPRDHIFDDLNTRFSRVTSLETIQMDGRSYVIAGGADDGLSLFELLPGGRLVHLDTVADNHDLALANVVTLAVQETSNGLQIFAGSEMEPGVTQLQVSFGVPGAVQLAWDGGETLTGTAGEDLLVGGAGADLLKGGGGADLLLDGGGEDRMQGGAGADLFLLAADGDVDHILDFDPRVDALDLSAWTMLRSMDQIAISLTGDGAQLSFRDEVLILHNPQGGTYDPALLAGLDVLNLSRVHLTMFDDLVPEPVQTLFEGTEAGETIHGNEADNTLLGLGGNDILLGRAGADLMDGGTGTDRAAYWTASAGVMVDLEDVQANTGDAAGDVYNSIEDLQGSKHRDDLRGDEAVNMLIGAAGNDTLRGRGGNDRLLGGDGNDVLLGGVGSDRLDGGAGTDRAAYWAAGVGVLVDLQAPQANTGDAAGDIFISIEDLHGSKHRDDLRGNGAANTLWGASGDDTLHGRSGADRLIGDAGNDVLLGGADADQLEGGAGTDRAAYWTASAGLLADLQFAHANTGDAAGDTYASIEDLQGSKYRDDLRGDNAANTLWGGAGNDLLHGRAGDDRLVGDAGNDVLLGGLGADTLEGGSGTDRAAYWAASAGVLADLQTSDVNTGEAAGDTYASIEDLQGSKYRDDLRGNNGVNTLWGGAGNDTLHGRGGDDRLVGDVGNDVLLGGAGADRLEGGAGTDRAAYWTASTGILADLQSSRANTGDAAGDIYTSIEDLQGSRHNDRLHGDAGANTLWGGTGNDILQGRQGNDHLIGQDGRDYMVGGAGNDRFTGGADADTFVFETGHDVIEDLTIGEDRLRLSSDLLGGGPVTGATLASFAEAQADGLLLDFGATGSVLLIGVTDVSLLSTAIDLL